MPCHPPFPAHPHIPSLSPSRHCPHPGTVPILPLSPSQYSPHPGTVSTLALSPSQYCPNPGSVPSLALSPSRQCPHPVTVPIPALCPPWHVVTGAVPVGTRGADGSRSIQTAAVVRCPMETLLPAGSAPMTAAANERCGAMESGSVRRVSLCSRRAGALPGASFCLSTFGKRGAPARGAPARELLLERIRTGQQLLPR